MKLPKFGWGSKNKGSQVSPITAQTTSSCESAFHSNVVFPTPWTNRVQTPVRRVPSGKLWGQPDRTIPKTYGGPQ